MGRGGGGGDVSGRMYNQKGRGQGYSRGGGGGGRGRGGSRGGYGGGGWNRKLQENMAGFLCSCNMNEKDCVKEAMNLLNEYLRDDDMDNPAPMPPQPAPHGDTQQHQGSETMKMEEGVEMGASGGVDAEEDIEGALEAEIHQLKSQSVRSQFKSLDTGVPNLVFISSTVKDPPALAHRILEDVLEKKEQKARFLLRLLPIETTCWASMDQIEGVCRRLFPKYFARDFTSFQILYKSRYNYTKIDRGEVIKLLAELVTEINPLNVVNLTNPKYSVIVEVVKNIVCIGVVTDFVKLKKFNLHEAAGGEESQPKASELPKSSGASECPGAPGEGPDVKSDAA